MSTPIKLTDYTYPPPSLAAPETVNVAPSLTSAELGQYWADLTTKGYSPLRGSCESMTEAGFCEAYQLGIQHLPAGDEPRIAYFFNAVPLFVKHLNKFPPFYQTEITETPTDLALFLRSHNFTLIRSVLQLIGSLEAKSGKKCREISADQLQITWESKTTTLYLQLPLEYEQSLDLISQQLADPNTIRCLSDALNIFSPDIGSPSSAAHPDDRLMGIYRALNGKSNFYASFRFLSLLAHAGFNPIDTNTVLDLPEQMVFIARTKQFDKLLPRLRSGYKNSRFASVLEAVIERVQKAHDTPRQAAVEALLVCNDSQVLSSAWRLEDEKRVDFLMETASTMPEEALPFALNYLIRICKMESSPVPIADQVRLLGAYL